VNESTEFTLIKYSFYWGIPLALIFGEASHRFFKRGRKGIGTVLLLIALGFFVFPFVARK